MTQTEVLRAQGRWWREFAIAQWLDWAAKEKVPTWQTLWPLYEDIRDHVYQGA